MPWKETFAIELLSRELSLLTWLRKKRPAISPEKVAADGLSILALLHTDDESGERPELLVRFRDGKGSVVERPLADFIRLSCMCLPEPGRE